MGSTEVYNHKQQNGNLGQGNGISILRKRLQNIHKGRYIISRGVRGRVVKVVDFKSHAPHRCRFESRQGLWNLSCEEAIQLAYGT
jgi:hypothetical protein